MQPVAAVSPAPGLVSRADLEEQLARVRGCVADPRAGVFGPRSAVWAVNKEAVTFLGAGRAALLQLAHPFVAHGVDQHSATRDDPIGRFRRTFRQVFAMVYGDLDAALAAARAVHRIHERITGPLPGGATYHANAPAALLWVHATLWDTSIRVYELVVRSLTAGEKARYYEETKRFARLFGIPDAILPPDWPRFRAYVDGMLAGDVLTVTPAAAEIGRFLFRPLHPVLGLPTRELALATAWLLPARLAAGFGLERGGARGRAAYERLIAVLRAGHPWLPRRVRYLPAYVAARRRLAGRTDRDRVGEWLERALTGA